MFERLEKGGFDYAVAAGGANHADTLADFRALHENIAGLHRTARRRGPAYHRGLPFPPIALFRAGFGLSIPAEGCFAIAGDYQGRADCPVFPLAALRPFRIPASSFADGHTQMQKDSAAGPCVLKY